MSSGNLQIDDYELLDQIYESDHSRIFKTKPLGDAPLAILKVLKTDMPSEREAVRFHQEYSIASHINSPFVIKIWGIVSNDDVIALKVEDFGGDSLRNWLQTNPPNLLEGLSIAIAAAKGLRDIHHQHTTHKDISPENIVWNRETKTIKIIDFGVSSTLEADIMRPESPTKLEGNLAYMSPEQTGRMNRPVDYRTDFYSLGGTLYELFTGKRLFSSDDPLELIHCHIAKRPLAPCQLNASIPTVLSSIILKLLKKNAEDRYQSAAGLITDLQEVERQYQEHAKVEEFQIAVQDHSDRFMIPAKLYGRDEEAAKLISAFDTVCQGSLKLTLVSGYSGVGKTSLVQELYRPLVAVQGRYISGKYDQYQRNVPYSAMVYAFNNLCDQIISEPQNKLTQWRTRILSVVGQSGQVLIEIIPKLQIIIGRQPSIPKVDPQAAKNRFNQLFINFIAEICQPNAPLVLFLDDLQWMDQASLDLLKLLLQSQDIVGLHVVAAYRDNEVEARHPLSLMLNELRKEGDQYETIHLNNLSNSDISQLIADTLSLSLIETQDLVDMICEKTLGNAFFATEFLKSLYSDGILHYSSHKWQWDSEKIRQQHITDNVVEFMASKVKRFNEKTQRVISMAACIGNEFDLATLALIIQEPDISKVFDSLRQALQAGMILTKNNEYQKIGIININGETIRFKFQHDRVQQAAYSLIEERDKPEIHYRIGILLRDAYFEMEERLFEIVSHLNKGLPATTDEAIRFNISELNYQAGLKALDTAAYTAAAEYFSHAKGLLPENHFDNCYDFSLKVYLDLARSLYINGQFDESEAQYPILLNHVSSSLDEVKVRMVQMDDYHLQGNYEKAIIVQTQGLALLGESLPQEEDALESAITKELDMTSEYLGNRALDQLLTAEEIDCSKTLAKLRLLVGMWMSAYLVSKEPIVQWCSIRMTNISLQEGNSEYAAYAYVLYGYICVVRLQEFEKGYQYGNLAVKLADNYDNIEMRGKVCFNHAIFVNHWTQHIGTSTELFRKAYFQSIEGGDWTYAVYGAANIISNLLIEGKPCADIEEEAQKYLDFLAKKAPVGIQSFFMTGGYGPLLNFVGKTDHTNTFDCEHFNENELLNTLGKLPIVEAWFYSAKLRSLFFFRHFEQAKAVVHKSDIVLEGVPSQIKVPEAYFYSCLILAATYQGLENDDERVAAKARFERYAKDIEFWSTHCPQNFLHKHHLVQAEYLQIKDSDPNIRQVLYHYNEARALADLDGYKNNVALALELKGRFWLSIGEEDSGVQCLQEALNRYESWGVSAKCQQFRTEFPILVQKTLPVNTVSNISTNLTQTVVLNTMKLDLDSMYKAAQAISSKVAWKDLIETMLNIVMESAGANRGMLLISERLGESGSDDWRVEASATVDQTSQSFLLEFNDTDDASSSINRPESVFNYVANAKKPLKLDSDNTLAPYSTDPYYQGLKSYSVLCHPIPMKSRISAMLYLENNLAPGVFTDDRQVALDMLLTQIGISLENSRLYDKIEVALDQQILKLEESNRELEQFAYVASHDLQAPLRHVTTYVELLQSSEPEPEESEKWMGFIVKAANKMKLLIDDLLSFSQITKEKSFTIVNLNQLVDDVLDTHKLSIEEAFAEVTVNELPTINVVDFSIRQVFQNLIGNALKFRASDRSPHIIIDVKEETQQWVFSVKDNGIGMEPRHLEKIFDVFQRLHTDREYAGTGIGLSICKKVVEFHGGAIWVDSIPNEGTTFYFTIDKEINKQ